MPGILSTQGARIMLEAAVAKVAGEPLILRLYSNDLQPVAAHTEADVTETGFAGYAPVSLDPAQWTVTPGTPSTIAYPDHVFASNAAQAPAPVYGYYLTQTSSGRLFGIERFVDGPYEVATATDTITVAPEISQV